MFDYIYRLFCRLCDSCNDNHNSNSNNKYSVPSNINNIQSDYSLSDCENAKHFVPPIYEGIVVKVYDGDTITIVSRLPYPESPYFRFSVRFAGIDTPEIKGKSEHEKIKAIQARDALTALILNKCIQLKNITTEKYGRLLADVYLDNLHLNKWLIDQGFAVPYNGGTKMNWN